MSHQSYLAQERQYQILNSVSVIIPQNNLLGAQNLSSLADRSISKRDWPSVILKGYDEHSVPVYTSELITTINAAYQQE